MDMADREALTVLKRCFHQQSIRREDVPPAIASRLMAQGLLLVRNREVFTDDMRSMIPVTEFHLSAKAEDIVKATLL